MSNNGLKGKKQYSLKDKIEELQSSLKESEDILNAIRFGKVDSIVVSGPQGERIFSLTSSETPYRIFLEEMEEGAVTLNSNGIILYCNHRFSTLLSIPSAQILGSNLLSLISPKNRQKFSDAFETGRSGRSSEVISFMKNGDPLYLKLSFRALSPETKSDICVIATDVTNMKQSQQQLERLVKKRTVELEKDIIRRKLTEKALSESKEILSALINSIIDEVWFADTNKKLTLVNPAVWKEFNGGIVDTMDIESIAGSLEVYRPDGTPRPVKETPPLRALLGEIVKDQEEIVRTPATSQLRHRLVNAAPVRNVDGTIIGSVSVVRDITERKNAEKALSQSKLKLDTALQNANIGLWEWNVITDKATFDERSLTILELEKGACIDNFKDFVHLLHEEDHVHVVNAFHKAIKEDTSLETVFRLKSGKTFISIKGSKLKDNGSCELMSGVCYDVSALKESTNKSFMKLNQELLRSNKDLENFAYVASHDLQEPLRMITSFTQLLQQQYQDKLDNKANEYINYAVDGSKRIYELLNGLLAYSRININGKAFVPVDLNRVIESVRNCLHLIINERNAIINSDKLPTVYADETQMDLLFQNLIANSIKFSPGPPRIFISSKAQKDNYIFYVRDEGIGIESQYFERIFLIFQRLMPRDQYEGTGLGLAICKRIVERHGGKIWLESESGKGTTFIFNIPKQQTSD